MVRPAQFPLRDGKDKRWWAFRSERDFWLSLSCMFSEDSGVFNDEVSEHAFSGERNTHTQCERRGGERLRCKH